MINKKLFFYALAIVLLVIAVITISNIMNNNPRDNKDDNASPITNSAAETPSTIPTTVQNAATNSSKDKAYSLMTEINKTVGKSYPIEEKKGSMNIKGYIMNITDANDASIASSLLSTKVGTDTTLGRERGLYFNSWSMVCEMGDIVGGVTPTYVWCAEKIGQQIIDVTVNNIRNLNSQNRTFELTIGKETMTVKMPETLQNTEYKNGSFADFEKAVKSSKFMDNQFKMTGEIKSNVFEVKNIQWLLG